MMQHHKYSLTELENMMPWERDIYIGLLMEFFNTMPKLRHTVEVKNPKTEVKSQVMIEGLESFLV